MCMLTFFPPGRQPDPDALHNGAEWNDDGHGFAIVAGDRLIIRHSMDADYLIAEFVRMRAKHRNGPALFHSRWGTGGAVTRFNCHPFRIGGDRRTVLAHNGVLPVIPEKGDRRSDTRITAEELLRGRDLGNVNVQEDIEAWMGPSNKFVILTVNPKYHERAWILNEKRGVWDGGIWYSNFDYRVGYFDEPVTVPAKRRNWWDDVADDDLAFTARSRAGGFNECWQCGSTADVVTFEGRCLACDICLDCGQPWDGCQCLMSAPVRRREDWAALDAGRDFVEADETAAYEAALAALAVRA